MPPKPVPLAALADLAPNQEADFFAAMTIKEEHTTRDGKPYTRVGFRDARREVQFPVWRDSPWAEDCKARWTAGGFYKLRAAYRETSYGGQLEIRKIRPINDEDRAEGFDPLMLLPRSRCDPAKMLAELTAFAQRIADPPLRQLVLAMLQSNRQQLLVHPASLRNHHAYIGGFVEHALAVTKAADALAQQYADAYPDVAGPLDVDLVVAGAILHDIGKLAEVEQQPAGAVRSIAGNLLGHVLLGRDMLREAAAGTAIDAEKLLRLEHILASHETTPDRGAARPPMTLEALLVRVADDLDTRYHIMASIVAGDTSAGPFTSAKNLLQTEIFRGSRG